MMASVQSRVMACLDWCVEVYGASVPEVCVVRDAYAAQHDQATEMRHVDQTYLTARWTTLFLAAHECMMESMFIDELQAQHHAWEVMAGMLTDETVLRTLNRITAGLGGMIRRRMIPVTS